MNSLNCPVCHQPLSPQRESAARRDLWQHATWGCDTGHVFDVARQGYLNLLLVQQKKSKQPGDTPDSLAARRRFLQAGFYGPIRAAVAARVGHAVAAWRHTQPRASVWDLGCGEGDYTSAMAVACADTPAGTVTGLDIAKAGIQSAASRDSNVRWLVGSASALPCPDQSVSLITSLFSPIPEAECRRVLHPDGALLTVVPDVAHLRTFREALFGQISGQVPEQRLYTLAAHWTCVDRQTVTVPFLLDTAAIQDLMAMTPYAWKATPAARAALSARDALETEAAVVISVFKKQPFPDESPTHPTSQ